jgi:hypothetical protein
MIAGWKTRGEKNQVTYHEGIESASMSFVAQKQWRAFTDSEEMMLLQEKEKERWGPRDGRATVRSVCACRVLSERGSELLIMIMRYLVGEKQRLEPKTLADLYGFSGHLPRGACMEA